MSNVVFTKTAIARSPSSQRRRRDERKSKRLSDLSATNDDDGYRSSTTLRQQEEQDNSSSSHSDEVGSDGLPRHVSPPSSNKKSSLSPKSIITLCMGAMVFLIIWDATFRKPEDRWLQPGASQEFLEWVQAHPATGIFAILLVIATAVVFMIPIGTPLTLGCGFIYKGAYGWKFGLPLATIVAMGGSAIGAVVCFLLGRYLMREQVRQWVRKYPLFDAIDVAAAEHGLRIMAMLYLTPILPLGPVSYMCGTTSMALSSFVLAKIASLPLMLLYAFIGASTGALIGHGKASQEELQKIEENEVLIVSGIGLSFVMIACITHYIKKELNKILERQKKHKPGEMDDQPVDDISATEEAALEMGVTAPRQRRNV